jgi:hypothetical protein
VVGFFVEVFHGFEELIAWGEKLLALGEAVEEEAAIAFCD